MLNYSWKASPNRWGRPEFNAAFSIGFGNGLDGGLNSDTFQEMDPESRRRGWLCWSREFAGTRTSVTRVLSISILIAASVWLTVLQAHAREDHLQYLFCPTLCNARVMVLRNPSLWLVYLLTGRVKQVLGASKLEVGIQYPTEQTEHSGKYHVWYYKLYHSLIYDIILDITYDFRCRAEKPILEHQIALLTII